MDIVTARSRIHAMLPTLDNPAEADSREAELDQRIDDLISAARTTESTPECPDCGSSVSGETWIADEHHPKCPRRDPHF